MIGHDVTYTQTNLNHWLPVCSCEWFGIPTPWQTIRNPRTQREVRNLELTKDACHRQWVQHLDDVRADIATRSEAVLTDAARFRDRVIPTVLRPGRFGRG